MVPKIASLYVSSYIPLGHIIIPNIQFVTEPQNVGDRIGSQLQQILHFLVEETSVQTSLTQLSSCN